MKKRLAWFCPQSVNQILLSQILFPSLTKQLLSTYEIDLFLDDLDLAELTSSNTQSDTQKYYHYLQALQLHRRQPYHCFIYQIEDHLRFKYVARHSELMPGLTFFHDINLNHLYLAKFKHSTGGSDLNSEMDEIFGKQSARLGDYKVRGWASDIFDNIYIRGQNLINKSGMAIVENASQANYLAQLNIDSEIFKASYDFSQLNETAYSKNLIRRNLGFADQDIIISFSMNGYSTSHLRELLNYFQDVHQISNDCKLLIITNNIEESLLAKLKSATSDNKNIVFYQATGITDFLNSHAVADLHYAVSSDTLRGVPLGVVVSSYLGIPSISSEIGWARDLPDEKIIKISFFEDQTKFLSLLIRELQHNKNFSLELSKKSHLLYYDVFLAQNAGSSNCQISNLIERYSNSLSQQMLEKESIYQQKKRMLFSELNIADKKLADVISNCKY